MVVVWWKMWKEEIQSKRMDRVEAEINPVRFDLRGLHVEKISPSIVSN